MRRIGSRYTLARERVLREARIASRLTNPGVVHRDVKPSNVMVPDKGTAKLADFGIAQSYEDSRITSTGTLVESPAYMSPERLEGGDAHQHGTYGHWVAPCTSRWRRMARTNARPPQPPSSE